MGVIQQAQVETVLRPVAGADACGPDLTHEPLPPAPGQAEVTVRQFWNASDPAKAFVNTEVAAGVFEKIRPEGWAETTFGGAVRILAATKDLRAMVRLAQAAMVSGGVEGFAEGVELLLEFVLRYWDGLHPRPGPDGGQDERLAILDQIGGAIEDWEALAILSKNPTTTFKGLGLSGNNEPAVATLAGAPQGDLQDALFWTRSCRRSLLALKTFWRITAPNGRSFDPDTCRADAPAFSPGAMLLRAEGAIGEVQGTGGATSGGAPGLSAGGASSGAAFSGGGVLSRREDVVTAIEAIIGFYKEHDVASPVPILLRRCQRLVTADFEQILSDLLNDQLNNFRTRYVGPNKT